MDIFIISWAGQHQHAADIATAFAARDIKPHIIYSDPDPAFIPAGPGQWIRRPNELFWSDKFSACLEYATGDMLVIHADCRCDDWLRLADRFDQALQHYPRIGVWGPLIESAYFSLPVVQLDQLIGSDLSTASFCEAIVFGLRRSLLPRMREIDYTGSLYGWAIDHLMCAHAYASGYVVAIDQGVPVDHPQGSGYNWRDAIAEISHFLRQMNLSELAIYRMMSGHKSWRMQGK